MGGVQHERVCVCVRVSVKCLNSTTQDPQLRSYFIYTS